jgi:predicted DNA repair protein MutK
LLHSHAEDEAHHEALAHAVADPQVDMVAFEQEKIKGAVRTDFILSAEIVAITLGTVASAPLMQQVMVLSGVSLLITVGVYGLVAAIVKMDDAGLHLSQTGPAGAAGEVRRAFGRGLLSAAPKLMKVLSVVGTAAMFLVGGSIVLHGLPGAHEWQHALEHTVEHAVAGIPVLGVVLNSVVPLIVEGVGGVVVGALALGVVTLGQKLVGLFRKA